MQFPLALARRRSTHVDTLLHRNTGGFGSHTFGSTSRTVPISDNSLDGGKTEKGKSKEKTACWPASLEEEYTFEEVHDVVNAQLKEEIFLKAHLFADLELHTQLLSTVTESGNMLPKKRVGRRKGQPLTVVQMDTTCDKCLDMSNRGIVKFTQNIGLYANIVSLNLAQNELTHLPEELGLLHNLEELNVSENRLVRLPDSIGQLRHLRELNLKHNELTTFPKSIGNLQRLRILIVSHNRFRVISREIGGLAKLMTFEAEHNQIEYLPAEMSLLGNLRIIQIHGNPLVTESYTSKKEAAVSNDRQLSLLEAAARSIIRTDSSVLVDTPFSLRAYLLSAEECIFCHGPFIEKRCGKIRYLQRGDQTIPFMYYLCSPHWNTEEDRIRAMFQKAPQTIPKNALDMRRKINRTATRGLPTQKRDPQRPRNGMIRLSQLSKETYRLIRPKYEPMLKSKKGIKGGAGAIRITNMEQLSHLMSQNSIVVECGWLDVPTVFENH
jgi:hypothetical protein